MKIIDYELVSDISYLFGKRIFIYGTGVYGNKVIRTLLQMEVKIDGFCETNPKKDTFLGKKVLSVKVLTDDYDESDVLVLIASEKYFKEMIDELRYAQNMSLCTYYALFISLFLNYETRGITELLKNNIVLFKKISINTAVESFFVDGMKYYCEILSQPSSVWIYQPGKVGSASIYWSNPLKTCHLHSLAYAFNVDDDMPVICNEAISRIKKGPIKIITGIREPISRDISLFFQSTESNIWPLVYYGHCLNYLFGDYSKDNKLDIQTLKKRICVFEENLNQSFECLGKKITENRSDEFSWFDYEIKALLGVDIYAYPFDRERGYEIIEQDNIRILIYKCEKLNQLEKVIGDFLEEPEFSLINANQGDEKVYSYVYKRFKEEVKLTQQYFDYYYADNPRLRHFYTDSEIEQFKDKWKGKIQ